MAIDAVVGKIKRSKIQTFIDTSGPTGSETYFLLGEGIIAGDIEYNPKILEETYVSEDSPNVSVESYAPKQSIDMAAINDNEAFEYIDALRIARAVLTAAETTIVNVWMYEAGGPDAYVAEQQKVCISVETFGGEGGSTARTAFTIHYIDDPTVGTFDVSDNSFT